MSANGEKKKRRRVLVVDDQPFVAYLIQFTLGKENLEVVPLYDPVEALEQAPRLAPDLMILDVMMPKMNGIELCRRLRQLPETAAVPVIVLTAHGHSDTETEAASAGANAFMTKPFSPRLLAKLVLDMLDGGATAGGGPDSLSLPGKDENAPS